ncbi:MAG TPA: cytochrome P450 [Acidimicrobiia bacterium]|nr:cytochrome P450 [Acidimicrobiia bacterium]
MTSPADHETIMPVIDPKEFPSVVEGVDSVRLYDELREKYPFFKVEGDPAVYFTRWASGNEILRKWQRYSANIRGGGYATGDHEVDEHRLIPPEYDPPLANRYKALLRDKYSPEEAQRWEPRMRRLAGELVDGLAGRGEADYVADFSTRYFPRIVMEWLGLPAEDFDRVQEWDRTVFTVPEADPDMSRRGQAVVSLQAYLAEAVRQRREQPDDGFISFVLAGDIDGRPISDVEARQAALMGVLGGSHTVTAMLGYVMRHLADHPELRARFVKDVEGRPRIVEELLRWYALGGTYRTVTEDHELDGCPLRQGDVVMTLLNPANRDPRSRPGADELDPDREPNTHLTFAAGVHLCLGIHFARSGLQIALEEWLSRIPDFELRPGATPPEQIYAGVGYLELPFVWPVQG